jgi:hypothetical protein
MRITSQVATEHRSAAALAANGQDVQQPAVPGASCCCSGAVRK